MRPTTKQFVARRQSAVRQTQMLANSVSSRLALCYKHPVRFRAKSIWLAFVVVVATAQADVLVGINGERFVGNIIQETADSVVFESELGGRITIPRSRVRELQRGPAVAPAAPLWKPPQAGQDKFDWIQLKSDEWLKGHLKYIQDKKVDFESDKLEELSLKLKDVLAIYTGKPMFVKFDGQSERFGKIVLSNDVITVAGAEPYRGARDDLTAITPGGSKEVNFWSGRLTLALAFQSGNSKQTSLNTTAELARRTPSTELLLDYMGNFNEVEGTQNANNHRFTSHFDYRLTSRFFVRVPQVEYYDDSLANIKNRVTGGIGIGYYIFDHDELKWLLSGGPGVQYLENETVVAGKSSSSFTPTAFLQSSFNVDITRRLTFIQSYGGYITAVEAGLYSHHMVSTLEFEVTHIFDLNISFVWDYLQNPQTESNGTVPLRSDLRLTCGLGVRF
jgi:putative salt-induced outer membrane protein YdiY